MKIKKKIVIGITFLILSSFFCNIIINYPLETNAKRSFFTLVGKTFYGSPPFRDDPLGMDCFNFLKQYLAKIGINLEIIVYDWPTFIGELLVFRDFDICFINIPSDLQGTECLSIMDIYMGTTCQSNLFGYDESMDWDSTLVLYDRIGWGKNEWYLRKGTIIMPPDSEERVHHYWAWEQHLMENILPCQPLFTSKTYIALWENLDGYNYTNGLLQSWGKMSINGVHLGQKNTDEVVIADAGWSNLNPLFQDDSSSAFISSAIFDPLIYYDADLSVWPHLAKSYTMVNDTYVRIVTREGIKWQDPGRYPNEYFDASDVYFTLYARQTLSNNNQSFSWIDMMKLIDDKTLDIFIDRNPSTSINEPCVEFLSALSTSILPEHYLNQTQLDNGITPDILHDSWTNFTTHCFGTGLFKLSNFTAGIETTLSINNDCWMLDPTLTNDSTLDFERRFGDFTNSPKQLRVRIIPEIYNAIVEFERGRIDIVELSGFSDKKDQFSCDATKEIQSNIYNSLNMFGYNLREIREVIGNRDPCSGNSSISKGLAIRKAISYAINRNEMNDIAFGGKYVICDWPIYQKMGIWCNPNIIRYDHNLDKAKEYMALAGYGTIEPTFTNLSFQFAISIFAILVICIVLLQLNKSKKRKRM